MEFILHKQIGFDKDQLVMIQGANTLGNKAEAFQNELKKLSSVENTSLTSYLPINGTKRDNNSFWKEGRQQEDQAVMCQNWRVDENYISTMGMKLVSGRNFQPNLATDANAIIINQSMARELALEEPVGKKITNGYEPTYHVIGVMEDFHFETFKTAVGPLSLTLRHTGEVIVVKFQSENTDVMLSQVEQIWDEFMPNQSIRYTFMDDSYARMYAQVSRTGKVFTLFAALAVIVACLGLFALSAFMVEQRGKEISVRKVLGASLMQVFGLLTSNFIKLILIAVIIALPIGWYLMDNWLADYKYHVSITWDVYVIAGLISLIISLITISSESLKAGLMNPVKKLRSE